MAIPLEPSPTDPRDASQGIAELYGRYGADLFRLAYRLTGTKEDAEDVVHDVFVGLPEALKGYEERGRLDAWLRRITARVALMKLRGRQRRAEVRLETGMGLGSNPASTDVIALRSAVADLPEPLRHVLILKEVEGYSHGEIGDMLGISVISSRVRLARAKRRLRKTLGGHDAR